MQTIMGTDPFILKKAREIKGSVPIKVVVAMSGGVDSSTAACLLKEAGYDVIGLSMRLKVQEEKSDSGCCGIKGVDDAREVARKIKIPFYALNCEKEFEKEVISYFCDQYGKGRTPNPCIACNEKMKFGVLLRKAEMLGAAYIATGHYARLKYDRKSERHIIRKAKDSQKDQSYFLFSLTQAQLSKTIFPVGDYRKEKVRRIAKGYGLKVHDKPGSQEICFIPDGDYRRFLESRMGSGKPAKGDIVDTKGRIIGEHNGIAFYTIGQRKGIGAHGKPLWVARIDEKTNTIVAGEDKDLYGDTLEAHGVNWISRSGLGKPLKVKAKIRYRHRSSDATVSPLENGNVTVKFEKPQRAITPGQAVVFYEGNVLAGGGWIMAAGSMLR